MFFWLTVLTFLAGLLMYSLHPRSDRMETLDKPRADALVVPFIAQHVAALQAVSQPHEDVSEPLYASQMALTQTESGELSLFEKIPETEEEKIGILKRDALLNFGVPGMSFQDMTTGLTGDGFRSAVFCVNNADSSLVTTCRNKNKDTTDGTTTDFLITWANLDDMGWGTYFKGLAPRAIGERLFLTRYTPEAHLQMSCGFLLNTSTAGAGKDFQPSSTCAIDTTRYQDVYVPTAFTALTGCNENIIICISRLFATYDTSTSPATIIRPE